MLGHMAKKRSGDRHRPSRHIRIPERLAKFLDQAAERNFTTAPQEAVRAIREYLERLGILPQDDNRGR
jgi:hypothetical protein